MTTDHRLTTQRSEEAEEESEPDAAHSQKLLSEFILTWRSLKGEKISFTKETLNICFLNVSLKHKLQNFDS